MNKAFLGIDLGTSAVKAVLVRDTGTVAKARATYDEISPAGWYRALGNAVRQLDLTDVAAVRAMLAEIDARGTQVDVVLNNAGMQIAYRVAVFIEDGRGNRITVQVYTV